MSLNLFPKNSNKKCSVINKLQRRNWEPVGLARTALPRKNQSRWHRLVPCKELRYQPNPFIRFWAMTILRIRVSNRLIFCYMSCLRARQKHNLLFNVHCSKTMRWIYLIIGMTNCHILGFDLPFTELIYLIWFLCKSRSNTDDRTPDTLYNST